MGSEMCIRDREQLMIEPPANPLDAGNFQTSAETGAISRDRRLLDARRNLEVQLQGQPQRPSLGLAMPLQWRHQEIQDVAVLNPEAIQILNLWLHAPQSDWLKRQGIEAGEWCDAVEDLSPLSMDELDRHRLIRERLAEQLDHLAEHPETRWDHIDHVDWRVRLSLIHI